MDEYIMTQVDPNDVNYTVITNDVTTIDTKLAEQNRHSSCDTTANADGNVWGLIRRKGGNQEETKLYHRPPQPINGQPMKDTFTIGRGSQCDIIVNNNTVSTCHCMIYCVFSDIKFTVYLEDTSVNGTFVNDSLTRVSRGSRMELKSGDEIFLTNPRKNVNALTSFSFVNIRERLVANREIVTVPNNNNLSSNTPIFDSKPPTSLFAPNRSLLDHYIVGDQIGSGMCGQVYYCVNRISKQQCAVKVIDTRKFSLTPGLSMNDLKEEAALMQQLDHPNIVKIFDTFQSEHGIYIIMELLRGGDLFDRIVERRRYNEDNARKVMLKLFSAIQYLHSQNIIHRDIKPENILLMHSYDDIEIKLTDFGLAKKTNQEGLKTFCGTPQYFAPEVLKRKSSIAGAGRYGPAADMWSLGVVLYILLSGTFPFDEDNLFDQIQRGQYSVSGPEWSDVSADAKGLIKSLLTLKPDTRITIQQAMKHPWIRCNNNSNHNNNNTNEASFVINKSKSPNKNQYYPKINNNNEAFEFAIPTKTTNNHNISQNNNDVKSTLPQKTSVSSKQKSNHSSARNSSVHPVLSVSSRPHIGTVPLFLVKKTSIFGLSTATTTNNHNEHMAITDNNATTTIYDTGATANGTNNSNSNNNIDNNNNINNSNINNNNNSNNNNNNINNNNKRSRVMIQDNSEPKRKRKKSLSSSNEIDSKTSQNKRVSSRNGINGNNSHNNNNGQILIQLDDDIEDFSTDDESDRIPNANVHNDSNDPKTRTNDKKAKNVKLVSNSSLKNHNYISKNQANEVVMSEKNDNNKLDGPAISTSRTPSTTNNINIINNDNNNDNNNNQSTEPLLVHISNDDKDERNHRDSHHNGDTISEKAVEVKQSPSLIVLKQYDDTPSTHNNNHNNSKVKKKSHSTSHNNSNCNSHNAKNISTSKGVKKLRNPVKSLAEFFKPLIANNNLVNTGTNNQ
eukprot:gene8699-11756_t